MAARGASPGVNEIRGFHAANKDGERRAVPSGLRGGERADSTGRWVFSGLRFGVSAERLAAQIMEQHEAELTLFERAWAWFELNRKQVAWGAGVVVVAGLVVSYYFWQDSQREVKASLALSEAMITGLSGGAAGDLVAAYRRVAAAHPRTAAGARAVLLAAARLFEEGKYSEAQAEFQRCLREYPDNPFRGEAMLGVAASLEAQGQTEAAIQAYQELLRRLPHAVAAPQAKFSLARLYEAKGRLDEARELYEDLARTQAHSSFGNEAVFKLQDLRVKHGTSAAAPTVAPSVPAAASPPKAEASASP